MQIPEQYRTAESFERYLGDPADPTSRVSFATALELDEREMYPSDQHSQLDSWGLPEMYIPQDYDGRLTSFEEAFALLRVLSRRDLTVAETHAITFLAALPVWVAGSADQKRLVADLIRSGHKIAFGVTERDHGGDLLANEFEARTENGRFLVSGEKWLIGNATRSTAVTLFARTRLEGGPRGFSLLFADKRQMDSAAFQHLPKVQTIGLRGADLSGIRFERCQLPASARIGSDGSGFELALKSLQITRTLCAGLSLGAGDTALRLAVDFAIARRLYGDSVFAIPHARATLTRAFVDLMICDAVAISATRALQTCPGQASVWSAVAKYFVPTTVENAIREIAVVLGARFFLRDGHPWSMFQKMARDSAIVSVFEGSTLVQLHALGLQLDQLTKPRQTAEDALNSRLEAVFSLKMPLARFQPEQLDLFSRDGDDAVAAIPIFCERLRSAGVSQSVLSAAQLVSREYRSLTADIGPPDVTGRSLGRLQFARRFIRIHAAACCMGFWVYNREMLGDFFCREQWLSACLNRLYAEADVSKEAEVELVERYRRQQLFSAVPFQLASPGVPHE